MAVFSKMIALFAIFSIAFAAPIPDPLNYSPSGRIIPQSTAALAIEKADHISEAHTIDARRVQPVDGTQDLVGLDEIRKNFEEHTSEPTAVETRRVGPVGSHEKPIDLDKTRGGFRQSGPGLPIEEAFPNGVSYMHPYM